MSDELSEPDLTLTSASLARGSTDEVALDRTDLIAERVLSEREPLPFQTRFPLGGTIGKGGMAEVFFARDRVLNRVVAVKVMHGGGHDEVHTRRFLREAQITAQLSHPNVVPVHAMENNGRGQPAFVMKCITGQTFKQFTQACRERLGAEGFDPDVHGIAARLDHFLKVCDAISFAHSRGVIHRDIKPANLMIGSFGEVYVMDWGIAKVTGDDEESVGTDAATPVLDTSGLLTGTGGFIGTPMYMPPEQAEPKERETGPPADQYALGMVLYELLALRLPREADDVEGLVLAAKTGLRRGFDDQPPVPRELQAVVERATALEPEDRYPSVAALAADVRHFQRNEELVVYPDDLVRRAWRRVQRHPVRAMAVVLAVLVIAAITSITSLWHSLGESERHERETRLFAGLVAKVSEFVHDIDQRAKNIELLVESLGVQIESSLQGPADPGVAFPSPAELGGPSAPFDLREVDRYGQRVTFDTPVQVVAPTADPAGTADRIAHLGGATALMQAMFLRHLRLVEPDRYADLTPADLYEHGRLTFARIALDCGALLNFPGTTTFPADYDPRVRSWFVEASPAGDVAWGTPYSSASGVGRSVPCSRRIRGATGEWVGVVGVDAQLASVLRKLRIDGLEHQRRSLLVDDGAQIVATETAGSTEWSDAPGDGEPGAQRVIEVPDLAARILAADYNGIVRAGDALFVFSRLTSLGWYLVVELDAAGTLAMIP